MNRTCVLLLVTRSVATPLGNEPQPTGKVVRIGFIRPGSHRSLPRRAVVSACASQDESVHRGHDEDRYQWFNQAFPTTSGTGSDDRSRRASCGSSPCESP